MYSIKILDDAEFEALPFPEMETSLGVADPATKTAYVRHTGIDQVDKYLVIHELEHLIEGHGGEHSNHYRNGVYYKGFGEVMSQVGMVAAPFLGPLGVPVGLAAGAGQAANQRQAQKKSMGQQQSMMQPQGAMDFPQVEAPQQPNIITPGSAGGGMDEGGAVGGSAIDRVKGFFSGRNPVGGF